MCADREVTGREVPGDEAADREVIGRAAAGTGRDAVEGLGTSRAFHPLVLFASFFGLIGPGARDRGGRSGALHRTGTVRRRGQKDGPWTSGMSRRACATLAASGLLLAGCASMPDSGDVRQVGSTPRADADAPVRVYGVRPGNDEQPRELVLGFLEATTSDEARFETAREYLTKRARDEWNPLAETTVLAQAPKVRVEGGANRDTPGYDIVLSGKQLATVDANHAYEPDEKPYEERVHVAKSGSQWRIDSLPAGLVLGESDFQRIYRSVNKYYFAELGPDGDKSAVGKDVLVADPVYLRRWVDPVTSTVRALLGGPTNWLEPVVRTSFPSGTQLDSKHLRLDDSNELRIGLSRDAAGVDQLRCHEMAAQVLFTVQDLATSKVSKVVLESAAGAELCSLTRDQAEGYAPDRINGKADNQYFIDEERRMVQLDDTGEEPEHVPGPFGEPTAGLGSIAVARDERTAAGVSQNGRDLYVADLKPGVERGGSRLRSATGGRQGGLTVPSWDGLGDLWVADRSPGKPRLLRLASGVGEPEEVNVTGLDGGRIVSLRVAADSTRIALLIERDGHTSLWLGRLERAKTSAEPPLSVKGLRSLAPQLDEVDAVSWAGGSRLVVAGTESGGVQELRYMETDGSPGNSPTLPGPGKVEQIAASEDENRPLIAKASDGIVRLPPDANWKTVVKKGTAPVYPG
ncbi:LpqB family beta-propeller domain-containing protein [Streptomyces buecherae]|uniref:LpqB family beta-propeller domain-containing protein n=1 Tax=Streptomyces buecherae TaxID=2763006 RepID=UPI00369B65B6